MLKSNELEERPLDKNLIEQLREYAATEEDQDKARDLTEAADLIENLQGGRSTPLEEFPEDGLHPETEKVISKYIDRNRNDM